jgi:hypothetical protein
VQPFPHIHAAQRPTDPLVVALRRVIVGIVCYQVCFAAGPAVAAHMPVSHMQSVWIGVGVVWLCIMVLRGCVHRHKSVRQRPHASPWHGHPPQGKRRRRGRHALHRAESRLPPPPPQVITQTRRNGQGRVRDSPAGCWVRDCDSGWSWVRNSPATLPARLSCRQRRARESRREARA